MRLLVVDAFTDRPFAGNPAGVCLLDGPADPVWMQRVAAEMRHSETAFVRRLDADAGAEYELRWFTPEVEVGLCGHATLASAHALYTTGLAPTGDPIRFRTLHSGVLTVISGTDGLLEMDFPAVPAKPVPEIEGLAHTLGTAIAWTGRNAQNDLLLEVADEDTVRKLTPDIPSLAAIDARAVTVTAQAAPGSPYDYVSRVFAPSVGIPEDPVTGSAHCALAPYWTEKLGRPTLIGYQASPRGGKVQTELRTNRVTLTGQATTVLDGNLST